MTADVLLYLLVNVVYWCFFILWLEIIMTVLPRHYCEAAQLL